ncbi:hypothetical protein O9992_09860 [Vibrio lentus]|nr:hypothetical protein [Vibrio lentus]
MASRNSSIALSNAKQDKARVSICRVQEMGKDAEHRTKMLARLNKAIELPQQFEPFYQPIID